MPRLVLSAGLLLVVLVFIPGLANPFVVPKESLVALTAAFVVLLVVLDARPTIGRWPRWWTAVLAAPVAAVTATALLDRAPLLASDGPLRWWCYALFFVAVRLACSRGGRAALLRVTATLGGIEGAFVAAQVLVGNLVFDMSGLPSAKWRAFGTLGNPNWVGGFLAATLPLALADVQTASTGRERRRAWVLAGAILTGLMLTFSRGAWFAAAGGAAVLMLIRRDLSWQRVVGVSATVIVLAAATAWVQLGGNEVTGAFGRSASLSGRARMWTITMTMIAARPLGGWGTSRFAATYPAFQRSYVLADRDMTVTDLTDHPHNDYLHVAAECGVPTMLAFVAVLVLALSRAVAARSLTAIAPLAASVAALALLALVDAPFRLPATAAIFCVLLVVILDTAAGGRRRPLGRLERVALAALAVLALFQTARLLVVDRSLAASRLALASGDTGEAQRITDTALRLDGSNAELWTVLAQARYLAGDEGGALAAATRARALRTTPDIVYLLADVERRQGQSERAIADLRDLSETVPGLLRPRVLLGEAYADAGRIEDARAVLTAVLAMRSKVPSADERLLHQRAADVLRILPSHDR